MSNETEQASTDASEPQPETTGNDTEVEMKPVEGDAKVDPSVVDVVCDSQPQVSNSQSAVSDSQSAVSDIQPVVSESQPVVSESEPVVAEGGKTDTPSDENPTEQQQEQPQTPKSPSEAAESVTQATSELEISTEKTSKEDITSKKDTITSPVLMTSYVIPKSNLDTESKAAVDCLSPLLLDYLNTAKLLVQNIPPETTEERLKEHFASVGTVKLTKIKTNSEKKSEGYGCVIFEDSSHIEKALEGEHTIDGTLLKVQKIVPADAEITKTKKLFVGGLPHALTESHLRDYFEKFGKIEFFQFVINKNTNIRKTFCFIMFEESDTVERITEGKLPPSSVVHTVNGLPVDCKKKFDDEHPIQQKIKAKATGNRYNNNAGNHNNNHNNNHHNRNNNFYQNVGGTGHYTHPANMPYGGYGAYPGYNQYYAGYYGYQYGYPGYPAYPGYSYPGPYSNYSNYGPMKNQSKDSTYKPY